MPAPARPASPSGFWNVTLSRRFEHHEFVYKPGAEKIVVNADVLTAMEADAGLVTNVAPA